MEPSKASDTFFQNSLKIFLFVRIIPFLKTRISLLISSFLFPNIITDALLIHVFYIAADKSSPTSIHPLTVDSEVSCLFFTQETLLCTKASNVVLFDTFYFSDIAAWSLGCSLLLSIQFSNILLKGHCYLAFTDFLFC